MNATANLTPYDLPQAKLLVLMNFLYVCDDENSLEQHENEVFELFFENTDKVSIPIP